MAEATNNGTARPATDQDYIEIIQGKMPGDVALGISDPGPALQPLSFKEKLDLTRRYRQVMDAASEVMTPIGDSSSKIFCTRCTNRLTGRFHLKAALPGLLTNNRHFTKRYAKLASAVDALPEGREKNLAFAFEKAAVYTYCIQEARLAPKTAQQFALIDAATRAVGEPASVARGLEIDCAARTGDWSTGGIVIGRLGVLAGDIHKKLLEKIEQVKKAPSR